MSNAIQVGDRFERGAGWKAGDDPGGDFIHAIVEILELLEHGVCRMETTRYPGTRDENVTEEQYPTQAFFDSCNGWRRLPRAKPSTNCFTIPGTTVVDHVRGQPGPLAHERAATIGHVSPAQQALDRGVARAAAARASVRRCLSCRDEGPTVALRRFREWPDESRAPLLIQRLECDACYLKRERALGPKPAEPSVTPPHADRLTPWALLGQGPGGWNLREPK